MHLKKAICKLFTWYCIFIKNGTKCSQQNVLLSSVVFSQNVRTAQLTWFPLTIAFNATFCGKDNNTIVYMGRSKYLSYLRKIQANCLSGRLALN